VLSEDLWRWSERDNGEIELHPTICQQLLAQSAPQLVARITCA